MGVDNDKQAVLDAKLRVRDIEGLRLCDMSAVPQQRAQFYQYIQPGLYPAISLYREFVRNALG